MLQQRPASSARLLILMMQLGFGLAVVAGASWGVWFVIGAPIIAAVLP